MRSATKTVTEFRRPGLMEVGNNPVFDLLGGTKADDLKKRFAVTVFREDANYVYLDVKPLLAKDQKEFTQVRLAVLGPNVPAPFTPYLPAKLWMRKPNDDEEVWTFDNPQANPPGVDAKSFEFKVPPGFVLQQAPAPP